MAEQFTKPGTANVSASDRKKLAPLLRHYASKPHPFGSCKRDQMKHGLSEDHANRRCAVLKDLIEGTTYWRGKGKGKVSKGKESFPWTEDVAEALDRAGFQLTKEKLSQSARDALPSSAFVYPGERRYPIHNLAHARNALSRSAGKPEEAKVRAAVHARYPQLRKSRADQIAKAVAQAL